MFCCLVDAIPTAASAAAAGLGLIEDRSIYEVMMMSSRGSSLLVVAGGGGGGGGGLTVKNNANTAAHSSKGSTANASHELAMLGLDLNPALVLPSPTRLIKAVDKGIHQFHTTTTTTPSSLNTFACLLIDYNSDAEIRNPFHYIENAACQLDFRGIIQDSWLKATSVSSSSVLLLHVVVIRVICNNNSADFGNIRHDIPPFLLLPNLYISAYCVPVWKLEKAMLNLRAIASNQQGLWVNLGGDSSIMTAAASSTPSPPPLSLLFPIANPSSTNTSLRLLSSLTTVHSSSSTFSATDTTPQSIRPPLYSDRVLMVQGLRLFLCQQQNLVSPAHQQLAVSSISIHKIPDLSSPTTSSNPLGLFASRHFLLLSTTPHDKLENTREIYYLLKIQPQDATALIIIHTTHLSSSSSSSSASSSTSDLTLPPSSTTTTSPTTTTTTTTANFSTSSPFPPHLFPQKHHPTTTTLPPLPLLLKLKEAVKIALSLDKTALVSNVTRVTSHQLLSMKNCLQRKPNHLSSNSSSKLFATNDKSNSNNNNNSQHLFTASSPWIHRHLLLRARYHILLNETAYPQVHGCIGAFLRIAFDKVCGVKQESEKEIIKIAALFDLIQTAVNQIAASFKNNSLSLFPDLSDAVSRKQTYRILLDELSDYCRIAFSSPPYKPELALKISNLIETSLGSSSTLQDFVFLTPPPANTTTGPPSNKKQKMTVSSPPSSSTSSTNESSWNDMESYKSMSLRERQELAEGGGGGGGGKRQKSYLVPAPPPHPDELAAEHLHRRSQFGESGSLAWWIWGMGGRDAVVVKDLE